MKNSIYLLALLLCSSFGAYAQISHGGEPSFSKLKNSKTIPVVTMPSIDVAQELRKDKNESGNHKVLRFAVPHKTNFNTENSGKWYTAENGDKYWMLAIESKGAKSLNLTFSSYKLPKGAKLFIYNDDRTDVRGAFTADNNKKNNMLSIAPIKGDKIIVEYHQPSKVKTAALLNISTVAHDYRGFGNILNKDYGQSGSCNINAACEIGDGWRDQIRSAGMILTAGGSRICSGSLINNKKNDGTPYFLTAEHCEPSKTWVFVFNYESPTCENEDVPTNQSISGGTILAKGTQSDYCLIEMSSRPPASYNVYYSGFDASSEVPQSAVGIHHPSADIKKISFENDPLSESLDNGGPGIGWWKISDWDNGTTEGGSSGSPLYNQDKRIVGQLTGGSAGCFGSESEGFDVYGNLSRTYPKLSQWLGDSKVIDGYDPNGGGNPDPVDPDPVDPVEPDPVDTEDNGEAPTGYCDANGQNTAEEFISRVRLGDIDNRSEGARAGYTDFTSISTVLEKGATHTFGITPTFKGKKYDEVYAIWIDYNRDGDFEDSDELVFTSALTQSTNIGGNFKVPTTAKTGPTRMRISMRFENTPSSCGLHNYGEVEDYTVVLE